MEQVEIKTKIKIVFMQRAQSCFLVRSTSSFRIYFVFIDTFGLFGLCCLYRLERSRANEFYRF